MPSLLLDTCALIWLAEGSDRLTQNARQRIDNAFVVYVSPVSLWEIARKVAKGVLKLPLEPQEWFARVKEQHNLTLVPLSETVAFKAATLPEIHKDPADRFLVATAIENKLAIVTADNIILQYGIECFC